MTFIVAAKQICAVSRTGGQLTARRRSRDPPRDFASGGETGAESPNANIFRTLDAGSRVEVAPIVEASTR